MRRLVILLLGLVGSTLQAMDGFYQLGYGALSVGMGGVAEASPQETLVVATNPAGMIWLGNRIDIGGGWLRLGRSTTLSDSPLPGANGRYKSNRSSAYPEFGINVMYSDCMSLGAAFYMKGLFDVRYSRALPPDGTSPERGLYRQYFLSPCFAVRPCVQKSFGTIVNSFGAAINIAIGRLAFAGLENLSLLSEFPENFAHGERATIWGYGFTFGWMAEFLERLFFGLSYQTRTHLNKAGRYKGFLPERGEIENPSTLAGGLGLLLTPYLLVAFDLGWIFWSDVEGFGNRVNSRNPFGSEGGPGFGWRDSIVAKLGVSYAPNDCLTLRLGYNYCRAPVIVRSVDNNSLTLATIEHHLTVGLTRAIRLGAVTLAYVHGFENRVGGPIQPPRGGGRRLLAGSQDQIALSWSSCY
jgi:long-chain fatty acid transport protein